MKFDTVVIGGGYAGFEAAMLSLEQGQSCALISEGRSLDKIDYNAFVAKGGLLMMGDQVTGSIFDGSSIKALSTEKLGENAITSDNFILATGRFFSGGLKADMENVFEPVFGLDLDFPADRAKWFDDDFFAGQPFMDSGVTVDSKGHPSIGGKVVKNLVVKGSILTKEARDAK